MHHRYPVKRDEPDPTDGRAIPPIPPMIPGLGHPVPIQYLLSRKAGVGSADLSPILLGHGPPALSALAEPSLSSAKQAMQNAMSRWIAHVVIALAMAVGIASTVPMVAAPAPAAAQEPDRRDPFRRQVRPLLERYCADCHMNGESEAGIALDRFEDQAAAVRDGRTWLRVRDALQGRIMPPADESQPSLEESERIVAWIENDFLAAECAKQIGSAPVVIRRLNRQEYNNTIRDLIGLDLHLADAFPPDEIGFGYDNVGSALNISPVHIEKYLDAAETALRRAIVVPDAEPYPPAELIGLKTYPLPPDKPVEFKHALKPGRYLADFSLVRVGIAESVPPPRLVIGFGKDRRTVDAVRVQDETVVYRYWLTVAKGDDTVHVALAPGQAGASSVKPGDIAANVSGDKRYAGDRGLHVELDGGARPRPPRAGVAPRIAPADRVLRPGIRRRLAPRLRPTGHRPVRRTGLPASGPAGRGGAHPEDVPPGARPGRELRARRPARPDDGPGVPAVPVPGRARGVARGSPVDRVRAGQPALVFPLEQHARRRADPRGPRRHAPLEPPSAGGADAARPPVRRVRGELRRPVVATPQAGRSGPRQGLIQGLRRRAAGRDA